MSQRTDAIRNHLETRHAETWPVLEGLDESDMSAEVYSSEEGSWTVKDLVGHLADGERGNLGLAKRLVAGEQTVPPDFDLDRWNRGAVRRASETSPAELMGVIFESYTRALEFLDGLEDNELDLVGLHSSGEMLTTEGFLRRMVDHRFEHVTDMQAALSKQS
ncbi:MAG: DinB family protein [Anaerolineales bacterium]